MALNGNSLGSEIRAAIDAAVAAIPDDLEDTDKVRDEVFKAIGNAIVAHIQNNAVVNTDVAVASVSGVTTGPSSSGPGTGTGTGTIT